MINYVLMALLSAVALLLLARPWWRRGGVHVQRRSANVAAYRTRLAELDNEIAAGLLDAEAAAQLKEELGARLLTDAAPADESAAGSSRLWWIVLVVPVFAAAWYGLAGSWRTQGLIDLAVSDPEAAQQVMIQSMVQRLEARLQQQPDDAEGWAMLGRSYSVLKRFNDSAMAYGKANEISAASHADWLVGEGEALALSHDRDLTGRPQQLFEAAVKLEPDHVAGLWFAGLAAAQAESYDLALKRWSVLLQRPDLPDDMRQLLADRMQQLAQLSGKPLPQIETKSAAVLALDVEVSLSPELQSQLKPQQTLFVFAKAAQGPPMPLAVQKLPAPQFPVKVRLDDSMAMMQGLKLSAFDQWTVMARLSNSGTVQAQSGDLEGSLSVARSEAGKPVRLTIDRRVP